IAMCYHYKIKRTEKDKEEDEKELNRHVDLARHCAEIVKKEYKDYDYIYSERYLMEESAQNFLNEIPSRWTDKKIT
ncbi:MAG: hypothetical protein KAX28_12380, partial [Candidatus Marinimicrobia bacterium]|nr:hypothetical protein [Candidatus Neomarinimicrobiota bacterium]